MTDKSLQVSSFVVLPTDVIYWDVVPYRETYTHIDIYIYMKPNATRGACLCVVAHKLLTESKLIQIFVAIWRHCATMGYTLGLRKIAVILHTAFHTHFLENIRISTESSLEFVPKSPTEYLSVIGSRRGLEAHRLQIITWRNNYPVHRCIYFSPGLNQIHDIHI